MMWANAGDSSLSLVLPFLFFDLYSFSFFLPPSTFSAFFSFPPFFY